MVRSQSQIASLVARAASLLAFLRIAQACSARRLFGDVARRADEAVGAALLDEGLPLAATQRSTPSESPTTRKAMS